MKPGKELIFLPLGGSGEIGMNVNLFGCNGKWVMVDLGMTFADPSYPGVDLVLPDLSFIEDRKADLLGVVLTHGMRTISARFRIWRMTWACLCMRRRLPPD